MCPSNILAFLSIIATTIAWGPGGNFPHAIPDHGGHGEGNNWGNGGWPHWGNSPPSSEDNPGSATPVSSPGQASTTVLYSFGTPTATALPSVSESASNYTIPWPASATNNPGTLTSVPTVSSQISGVLPPPSISPTANSTSSPPNSTTNTNSTTPSSNNGIIQGFNYASTVDFPTQFAWAKTLAGGGFTSARLYTMISHGSISSPISAIPAAIASNTTLLLGLYCSQGQTNFTHETDALDSAFKQYGKPFTDLIIGISVGSEDLYRSSVTTDGVGDTVANLSSYVQQTKKVMSDNGVSAKVGHVDTWQIWTNTTLGGALIPSLDFIGVDAYPYWQNTTSSNASAMTDALSAVGAVARGKEVWVTETGWPVNSEVSHGHTVASLSDAETYWNAVGCLKLFGKVNTWWYTLEDAKELASTPDVPSFGVVEGDGSALYNLTCSGLVGGEVSRRRRGVGRAMIGGSTIWE